MAKDWKQVAKDLHTITMSQDVAIDEQRRRIKELEKELEETISFYKSHIKDLQQYHDDTLSDYKGVNI